MATHWLHLEGVGQPVAGPPLVALLPCQHLVLQVVLLSSLQGRGKDAGLWGLRGVRCLHAARDAQNLLCSCLVLQNHRPLHFSECQLVLQGSAISGSGSTAAMRG